MQYFQAVQQGKQRAGKSQMKMFEVAGFGMLTLTTKKIDGKFHPVGDEEFTAVINSEDGHVAVIVDKDGFTKAQSKAVEKEEALSIYKKLRDTGIPEYPENGHSNLVSNKTYNSKRLYRINYFEGRIISVPTFPPLMAFSIIFVSAFRILVLIFERSIILRATISIKSYPPAIESS